MSNETSLPPVISLPIQDDEWEDGGEGRLLVTVNVNGTLHHLEAVPVEETKDASDQGAFATDYMDDLHVAFDGDGAFQRTEIKGKPYCLFMSPFCD